MSEALVCQCEQQGDGGAHLGAVASGDVLSLMQVIKANIYVSQREPLASPCLAMSSVEMYSSRKQSVSIRKTIQQSTIL